MCYGLMWPCLCSSVTQWTVEILTDDEVPAGRGPILMSEVECTGAEHDVSHCPHEGAAESQFCDHDDDLRVRCTD